MRDSGKGSAGGRRLLCLWALAWPSRSSENGATCSPMPCPTGSSTHPLLHVPGQPSPTQPSQLKHKSLPKCNHKFEEKELVRGQSWILLGSNDSVKVAWPNTPGGCAPFVMQVGGLLERVLPTWSLHPVFLSVATRTQRCGKADARVGFVLAWSQV